MPTVEVAMPQQTQTKQLIRALSLALGVSLAAALAACVSTTAAAKPTPTPTLPHGFRPINTRGITLMYFNDRNTASFQNQNQYDFIIEGGALLTTGDPAMKNLASQPGMTLTYFDPWTAKRAYDSSVPYSEARAKGWFAHTSSGALLGTYGYSASTEPLLNLTNTSLLNQMVVDAEQTARNYPGIKGFFMDNIFPDYSSELTGYSIGTYPATVYPSEAAWQTALLNAVKYIGTRLRHAGYFVAANISGYALNSGFDQGRYTQSWIKRVARTGGVEAVEEEYWMQSTGNFAQLRSNSSRYPGNYQGWLDLIKVAQASGMSFIPKMTDSRTDLRAMRYLKGSFDLEWDGIHGGVNYVNTPAFSGGDPWNTAWTKNIGVPTAVYRLLPNGCYTRRFSRGWVAVNPSRGSKTVTMNGKFYTIGATDAIIHSSP